MAKHTVKVIRKTEIGTTFLGRYDLTVKEGVFTIYDADSGTSVSMQAVNLVAFEDIVWDVMDAWRDEQKAASQIAEIAD